MCKSCFACVVVHVCVNTTMFVFVVSVLCLAKHVFRLLCVCENMYACMGVFDRMCCYMLRFYV